MKTSAFSRLKCSLNLYFAQKISQKGESCLRLLETQNCFSKGADQAQSGQG